MVQEKDNSTEYVRANKVGYISNPMQKVYVVFMMSIVLMTTESAAIPNDYQEKMRTLSSALTKLSASVEATLKKPLEPSTKEEASLREPFREYSVKILRENNHAIVLVCTKDGTKALLEDAGCTPEMDSNRWMSKELPPCTFILSSEVCKAH